MNRLSAPSNDKWRPQDCASDIQLTRPPPPPFPTPRCLLASFPIPLTTSGAGRATSRPGHGPRADRSRSGGSSVCPLLTFNQQSPNYCSGRVRTSDVIAIFAFPLFSRSTVLEDEEADSWTRIFFLFEICTNWCVKYISVFNCIRKFFALEN